MLFALFDELKVSNEAIIRSQTLDFWLKRINRFNTAGEPVVLGHACSDFAQVDAPTMVTGVVDVVTINLDALDQPSQPGARVSLLGQVGVVYASLKSLYITGLHWWTGVPFDGQQSAEYIHKFDIQDPNKAVYVASGALAGHINDQFRLDEKDDKLRVAHTVITYEGDGWAGSWKQTNRVSVLAQSGTELAVIGATPDLAEGEQIQSARFLGNKAFVVTYRFVDPLFTIDLSEPTNPRVIGELKIPGFSTYIHPLDENHLLTIGVFRPEPDANGISDWREQRQQLAIFDVSDLAHPTQKFMVTTGTAYGWSPATWNHKAFNYFPERKLLAVPFSDWSETCVSGDATCWSTYWQNFVSEVRVFSIDTQTGITPKGSVSLADVYADQGEWTWYQYSQWVRGSVMATDSSGNDFVYAIADAGIRVVNLQTLATVGTATFSHPQP